jgi:valyl-tRNA synthetase
MSHELPKAYDPSIIEERWAEYWVSEKLFAVATPETATGAAADPRQGGTAATEAGAAGASPEAGTQVARKKFTMLLPPPNVTGRLHIGHMLNQTEMDILTRWHRMAGDLALWVPGTDHAGIATQMMVERQLKQEGVTRQELGREAFNERVWQWKSLYGGAILDQMKRLGSTVDWSREYFTMDERLSKAVKEAFVRLHEQGLIYRGAYIVNWCPGCQTAISDLEVIHEEQVGKLYEIRYPLADGSGSIVIATTRPETMLGDTAVAVNPADERYVSLIGKKLTLPLSAIGGGAAREIPIVADEWANPEFGTGAVKVTPAHDPNDFAIGQRHNLPNLNIMDVTAHIDLPGSPYHGLDRYVARKKIVEDLEALGLLVAIKDHQNAVGMCDRSKDVVEPRLSKQWFVKIQPLADKAIEAVDKGYIKFTPEQYRKTYDEWMKNIHDWCISRQLWWGHRIPAWHCGSCAGITVSRETPVACEKCGSSEIVQETDVLDTWFSSGLLPFTVFGWPEAGDEGITKDLAAFYPTQVLVTGFDILFFWVARMIMLGCHFMSDVPMPDGSKRSLADAVPFREVYIHALVRDADRQKMSKTKGNVIDPIDLIQRFGTDAVRFTLASQASPGTDIAFSEGRTEGNRAFANKIWNAARFLFMNMDRAEEAGVSIDVGAAVSDARGADTLETRWILTRLSETAAETNRALGVYRFDEAASAVYQFFWGDLCDWYLEIVKLRLNFTAGEDNTLAVASLEAFIGVFEASLRLLSPFMPFITEEIWHALYGDAAPAKSIALTRFPQAQDFAVDAQAVTAIEHLKEIIVGVRGLRKEMSVPEKEAAPIRIFADELVSGLAVTHADLLAKLARVSAVEVASSALAGNAVRSIADSSRGISQMDVEVVYERLIDVPAEREKLTKDLAKFEKGLQAAERQLGNEAFMAKAPAHIVEGLRKQASETQMLYDKAKAALEALPAE